jgi:hypothetical protein
MTVRLAASMDAATALALQAPTLDATGGTTYGGRTVDLATGVMPAADTTPVLATAAAAPTPNQAGPRPSRVDDQRARDGSVGALWGGAKRRSEAPRVGPLAELMESLTMNRTIFAPGLFLILAGCMGAGGPLDDTGAATDEIRAREGQSCGGGTLHAPVCSRALTCVFAHDPPRPGERGTCQHPPACVQTALCTRDHHWDRVSCHCVADTPTDSGVACVQRVLCTVTSHFDHTACACVPNDGACATAADCHGVLPHFCRVCADGHSDCAHWSCTDRACTLATCN